MSVFVDTGVFYAHHDTDASRHEIGVAALNSALRSAEYGRVTTSDYVYDEAVTLTQRRTGSVADGLEVGRRIRGDGYPDAIELLYSSPVLFENAVDVYEQYADQELSFTDAMTAGIVEHHDIDAVLSFDDDFDGVVDRLAPESIDP
ncbi:MAG: type II toxin-antitoxin system VapC family toxin [Haloferacaceae archaeon]